jgi:hypothetical protein
MGSVRKGRIGPAATGLAVCCLLLLVPTALANPPTNDDFANRKVLSTALPLEVSGTNVEATKEAGEQLNPGLSPAGHTVWFEWKATSSEWVTIGACDSEFQSTVGIYTGAAVDKLTQVVSGNAAEGPDCPYQGRQYSFQAQSGTEYEVAVDGNGFYVPPSTPPATEGTFTLKVEATPPPPNDSFADATVLSAPIGEEPGGQRFYTVHTAGYNWTATTEPNEPFYGTGAGASVWYSWTAPESGTYDFDGPCCGSGLNWGLYVGESLGELNQMLAATGSAEVSLVGNTTYRIALYGTPDLVTGEPSRASFGFLISANLPPLPSQRASGGFTPAPPDKDTTSPETSISRSVLKRRPPIFTFHLHSNEPGSTFRCGLDRQPPSPCRPVERFGSRLRPGRHVLTVFAVDPSGNQDPTPATARFRMPKKPN